MSSRSTARAWRRWRGSRPCASGNGPRGAYPDLPHEVQSIWPKALRLELKRLAARELNFLNIGVRDGFELLVLNALTIAVGHELAADFLFTVFFVLFDHHVLGGFAGSEPRQRGVAQKILRDCLECFVDLFRIDFEAEQLFART